MYRLIIIYVCKKIIYKLYIQSIQQENVSDIFVENQYVPPFTLYRLNLETNLFCQRVFTLKQRLQ